MLGVFGSNAGNPAKPASSFFTASRNASRLFCSSCTCHQSQTTTHYVLLSLRSYFLASLPPIAKPYPTVPPSSAGQVAPAASGNLHPDKPSIFRSLRGVLSPGRVDSLSPRCTVFAARRYFPAPVVVPALRLPSPRPARVNVVFS